ncbi:alpha-L-rhamnosidase [Chitinophaga costaii]|uniref:Alpha-L-rhamnosidase n=1 Tax=Chitinophaga costaii TaxID=1335309 RepID=A0A1C4E0R6_9BACT|nr:glycosyl hydrolase [Chitinophaga costaii]PUZ24385.1 glycoside hydrolase family 2 [Chitinophaga costaii]SCC37198.1 alpha-L-rhamnosidase [Chitinophaga costaii]
MLPLRISGIAILFLLLANGSPAQSRITLPSFSAIETGFTHIPDSVQTSVYWYWISGNISKEGVVKDLEAMKKVGINRAFIGNIGLDDVPNGKVKFMSEAWWDILHTALKTATQLNIEIGIFNSPGWSQSGGPWIKPAQAMRYLTASQVAVRGPVLFQEKLAPPQPNFQDVKVLAFPVADGYATDISTLQPTLSVVPVIDSLRNLMDHDERTAVHFSPHHTYSLDINTASPYTVRSVIFHTTPQPVYLEGDIQAKINNAYVTVKHFAVNRINPALNVGFTPFGPAVISLPPTTSNSYRLVFTYVSSDCGITELKLSATTMVENYIEKSLAKMWATPHPFWEAYQWPPSPKDSATFVVDPATVIDISHYLEADGTLRWKVPAGNWMIQRSGMTPTGTTNAPAPPEGQGLEVDKMSQEHVTAHFNAFLGQILQRIPAEDRKTWKVTVEDSYETGSQNWTDAMISAFKQAYQYDPTPYIPVLQGTVVGSADQSDRFLWDVRRLIANEVAFQYVGGLRNISHQHGLTTWLENYGHWGFPGEFLQYGGQSDEVGGEFWSEGDLGDIENRAASSSAHIYGKTKVSAESFTAAGDPFSRYPAIFKKRGDRFFTEGINNTLLHVYAQQPDDKAPGITAWFGVEFNRLNTWFFDMDVFLHYIKRCNFLLQQGQYVADAAYFIGEDAPKMTGVTYPALPQGYSFDYINADVIKSTLSVKNGQFVLPNGIAYRMLVLSQLKTMRPELLAVLKELVRQGGVVLGPAPASSPSLQGFPTADLQVQQMAEALWGKVDGKMVKENHYGKGLVLNGMSMEEAFARLKVIPDVKITQSDSILFIHRVLPQGSIYFISNQKNAAVKIQAAFRLTGKRPELWNAVTGTLRDLPAYRQTNTTTQVPLQLAPYESAFVIFRKNAMSSGHAATNYPAPVKIITIRQPWQVTFDTAMRGPAKRMVFDSLTDWSLHANDSIKYYSGTAFYHNTFNIGPVAKGYHSIIDLGVARVVAKVKVNGVEIGGAWTPPYQLDITKALKTGENTLEIKVVNTWVNRLVGDALLPPDQRKAVALYSPDPKNGLQSSGLLGPVKIEVIPYE